MAEKLNLDDIKRIPQEEFKEILHSWMDHKEITQNYQKKLRKELISDFNKTELAKRLHLENQKNHFNSMDYVVDTLQAEHLYIENNHLTLSVFFTETRHPSILPNFEQKNKFRFEKSEVQELVELLGITKSDKISRRIQNTYKATNNSLLSVILKELVSAHHSTETRAIGVQTEAELEPLDLSVISVRSKSKKPKRGKNHGLVTSEFKAKKPKKVKEVTLIAQNLEKMSGNISLITKKLDDFKQNPNSDESKSIVGHVGSIMSQLNGCISNFESICRDIKQIQETRSRSYDEWMDDLRNSDNGRRFLKKLQKSFAQVMNEEKSNVQRDYRKKLEREKAKLAKLYKRKPAKCREADVDGSHHPIVKEISDIFQSSCLKIQNMERQDELFLKSLELDLSDTSPGRMKVQTTNKLRVNATQNNSKLVDLNKCRKLHSESSGASYDSKSFESEQSDENN